MAKHDIDADNDSDSDYASDNHTCKDSISDDDTDFHMDKQGRCHDRDLIWSDMISCDSTRCCIQWHALIWDDTVLDAG